MSERTDERTESSGDDVDVEELLDDSPDVGDVEPGETDAGLDESELGVDVDSLTSGPGTVDSGADTGSDAAESSDSGGLLSGLRPSLPSPSLPTPDLPSARSMILAFGVILVSTFAFSAIPLLGSVGGALGVFAGAFALGLGSGQRRYLPVAVAGAALSAFSAFTGAFLRFAVLSDLGVAPFAMVGAGTGVLAALIGHYFGRDLRKGVTRDVDG
jgi:hypothetical protein